MSSQIQGSKNNIIIDIPLEYIENGKTLSIEKHFELFLDGYHLSKPAHFIKHIDQLCLIDTQEQDQRSVKANHQLESDIDENQLIQIIIEVSSESLNNGKTIRIETIDSKENENFLGNLNDLYNQSSKKQDIQIKIPQNFIERGKTILIEKNNLSVIKTDDYQKNQKYHFNNNQFTKRDHLQSKNMMEIKIEVPPEFFLQGQSITITKEDPKVLEAKFRYRRQSKPDIPTQN